MRLARMAPGLVLATLVPTTVARAGNDDELLAGNQAAMVGGAVIATVDDASAAWYNPAGLGAITRSQVDVSGTAYTLRFYKAPDFLSLSSGESDDASVVEFVSIPTQIAYARALAPHATLALGYFVPQATKLVLREQLIVDNAQGHSEWQVAFATGRTLHTGVAALGFAATDALRLGLAVIGSYEDESESSVLFGAVSPDADVERLIELTAIGTGGRAAFEVGLGAQLDLDERLTLGLHVRSPRLQVARASDYVLTVGTAVGPQAGGPAIGGGAAETPRSFEQIALLRAGRAGVGIAYRYAQRSLVSAEVDGQPGLRDEEQDIRRKAVINARLGVYHALSPSIALGFGLFTDRSAYVPDGSPGNGGGDFYGGTFGIELSNEHALAPGEPVDSLIFSTVFALRYAFLDGYIAQFSNIDELLIDATGLTDNDVRGEAGRLVAHEIGLFVGGGLKF